MKLKIGAFLLLLTILGVTAVIASEQIVVFCNDGEIFNIPSQSDGPAACKDHGGVSMYGTAN